MTETSWWQAGRGTSHLLLLLVAQNLNVFLHERGVCTAENISLFEIFLLNIKECFGIEIVIIYTKVYFLVFVFVTSFTRIGGKFGEQSFALDTEGVASEERLDLICSFICLRTFTAISFDFINFLLIFNST